MFFKKVHSFSYNLKTFIMSDPLQKRFVDDVKGGNDQDKNEGTIEDLIQWLRILKFFEKTDVQESDVREAYEVMAKTTKVAVLTYPVFLALFGEIAIKRNIETKQITEQLMKLIKENEKDDQLFKEKLRQGKATVKEMLDNLESNPKVLKLRNKLKISKEDFQKTVIGMKEKASSSSITREELQKKGDEIYKKLLTSAAAKVPKVEMEKIIKKLEEIVVDMPIHTPPQSDDSEEDEGGKGTSSSKKKKHTEESEKK